jgi:hypothetical protein
VDGDHQFTTPRSSTSTLMESRTNPNVRLLAQMLSQEIRRRSVRGPEIWQELTSSAILPIIESNHTQGWAGRADHNHIAQPIDTGI